MRSTDLLKLKIKDVKDLAIGEKFSYKEGKTNKLNFLFMNQASYEVIQEYLESIKPYSHDRFLFESKKKNRSISLQHFGVLIQDWCIYAKVKNPKDYGVRSLRKTFGRLTFENSSNSNVVTLLKEKFNHKYESMTMKYLDITGTDMEELFTDK